ncbi:PIN2/TERF1-interacting telomerase inhibitor 1 isoform X3 [Equus asinus]|uniref:PIN2/TERF1-interacting telomerase inhibitor 1 isoform X3 n=1 Tax=Equus asinus TaxID=9793 RepID=UPI0038F67BF3
MRGTGSPVRLARPAAEIAQPSLLRSLLPSASERNCERPLGTLVLTRRPGHARGRRKQKWAVDPRNTAWSNDDSKFGQRMLEKMGWSKGKGLGAQEQGATDHIKVQVKNNHLGLGATINNEDNWIAHQDDFNQLLAELNTRHGQETSDSSEKEKKSFSLEEKSKISKNRVHYMKFTKGKDLSSRSKTDLDCIFGKRQRRKTPEQHWPAFVSGIAKAKVLLEVKCLKSLGNHGVVNVKAVTALWGSGGGADIDLVFASRFKEAWALTPHLHTAHQARLWGRPT